MKKNILLFFSMIFCLHLAAHKVLMMPGYENNLIDIKGLENDQGLLEVRFTFSDSDPVCNYVPASFDESNNGKMHRYFIPLHNMNEAEVERMIHHVLESCENWGVNFQISLCDAPCAGIECLFIGEGNISVEKEIHGTVLSFIISEVEYNANQVDWGQKESMERALSGGYFSNERAGQR